MTEEDIFVQTHPRSGAKTPNSILPERPGREPVQCGLLPGNPPCGMGSHGFICTFADGTCLRHPKIVHGGMMP